MEVRKETREKKDEMRVFEKWEERKHGRVGAIPLELRKGMAIPQIG